MRGRRVDGGSIGFERVQGLRLIDHILQRDGIGHQLIVDDGFFVIRRIVGAQMSGPTEIQELGEPVVRSILVVPLCTARRND